MRKLKLYLETSVWNFVFADDAPEKKHITEEFFNNLDREKYVLYISTTVLNEIKRAERELQDKLIKLIDKHKPILIEPDEEVSELAEKYLESGIIPKKKVEDAIHVAICTVNEIDALVTWNYQHLANIRKVELLNSVNLANRYTKGLKIIIPCEVITND